MNRTNHFRCRKLLLFHVCVFFYSRFVYFWALDRSVCSDWRSNNTRSYEFYLLLWHDLIFLQLLCHTHLFNTKLITFILCHWNLTCRCVRYESFISFTVCLILILTHTLTHARPFNKTNERKNTNHEKKCENTNKRLPILTLCRLMYMCKQFFCFMHHVCICITSCTAAYSMLKLNANMWPNIKARLTYVELSVNSLCRFIQIEWWQC